MSPNTPRSGISRAAAAAALTGALATAVGLTAGMLAGGPRTERLSAAAIPQRVVEPSAPGIAAQAPLTTTTPSATPKESATPSATDGRPDATPGLPNLVPVSGAWRETGEGGLRGCVSPSGPPGGLFLCVINDGETPAGPFDLAADTAPGAPIARASGLLAGEQLCLVLPISPGSGVIVDPGGAFDPTGAVAESNEDDNWYPPVLVPPGGIPGPTCAPTPTPGPGTPTAEPGPAAELAGFGWYWLEYRWGCMTAGDPARWGSNLAIHNDGDADAPAFRVAEMNSGATVWDIPDLQAGAMRQRDALRGYQPLSIDPDNTVREQDETNNAIYMPVPTQGPTCTPGPTPTAFPRPDVVVERAEVRAMGFDQSCAIPPIRVQVHVRVANRGNGFAEGITVEADGYRPGWSIRRLRPGETADLMPVDPPVSWVRARPLPYDDPSNNSRHVPQVTLTPPPTCSSWTPTPTSPAATETPTPTGIATTRTPTPSPTPGARGRALLPWADKGGPRP